jgi:hypothetical protein
MSSATTLIQTPPMQSVTPSQNSNNDWQSVTNKKNRKAENSATVSAGVTGTVVQEKVVVGAPIKPASQNDKPSEVKNVPKQTKDSLSKPVEAAPAVPVSEKSSPRMRGNVSIADTIVSMADTLVMPSSDYKRETPKADEWQTIKKGKVVKADEDSDVKTKKKKNKKKKAKDVDGQEASNPVTLVAQ